MRFPILHTILQLQSQVTDNGAGKESWGALGYIGAEGAKARTLDGGVELDQLCLVGGVELGLQLRVSLSRRDVVTPGGRWTRKRETTQLEIYVDMCAGCKR